MKAEGEFRKKVLQIIAQIPRGKILTYGQVATLAGVPRAARIVGGILHHEGYSKNLPWQRVLNFRGMLSTYRVGLGEEQRRLLEKEGHVFDRRGALDLKRRQWIPSAKDLRAWEVDEELAFQIAQTW
jgi:methylated-DNA-protein-cysteine methyltransferase related protein